MSNKMPIIYNCLYCGKPIKEDRLDYEGKAVDFQEWWDNKVKELSDKCECRKVVENNDRCSI